MLGPVFDMCDILAFYSKFKNIPLVSRNPGADSYDYIFHSVKALRSQRRTKRLFRRGFTSYYAYLSFKLLYRSARSNIKFFIKKKSLGYTSLIIPQTKSDYYSLKAKFNIKESRLALLPKPVDLNNFFEMSKSEVANKLRFDVTNKYILHVSNLYSTKGCDHIINILNDLNKLWPNIKLLVVGNGPKRKYLEDLASNLNVLSNVIFVGQIDHSDLVYYYNLADVFVLPTRNIQGEGQPNVILESIACNTPPISTNILGPAEILQDGLGLLVPMGDENELLKSIKMVLGGNFSIDAEKRKEFIRTYSIEYVGGELNLLFNKII